MAIQNFFALKINKITLSILDTLFSNNSKRLHPVIQVSWLKQYHPVHLLFSLGSQNGHWSGLLQSQ